MRIFGMWTRSMIIASTVLVICSNIMFSGPVAANLSATITQNLSSSINNDLSNQTREQARINLKGDLLDWFTANYGQAPDTTNPVIRQVFNDFFDKCLSQTKEVSSVKGKTWVFILSVDEENLKKLVDEHNEKVDNLALQTFNSLTSAYEQNNYPITYTFGVQALYYSMAHIGAPVKNPAQNGDQTLIEASRDIMQDFFKKVKLRSNNLIIEGKPGSYPQTPSTITAMVDSTPLAGMYFVGFLSGGKRLITAKSGSDGVASFAGMKIPYVAQGAFLSVLPNLGAVVDTSYTLTPADFNIKTSSLEQMLIFKITAPTYTLSYKVDVKGEIDVPKDFISDKFLNNFIRDSLHLKNPTQGNQPDISLNVTCTVEVSNFEQNEEIVVRIGGVMQLRELGKDNRQLDREFTVYRKAYEAFDMVGLPLGLFFWEGANNLKQALKNAILDI